MCFKLVVVMGFQKQFYLLCEEGEKLVSRLGLHQSTRYGYFRLREREGLVAVKDNAANAEICAAQVDRQIDSLERVNTALRAGNSQGHLFSAIGNSSNVRWYLAHHGALFLQTFIHLPNEFLDPFPHLFGRILEFCGDLLGSSDERHIRRYLGIW
jgi:hypothetical protein